jgi:hypothetical protein
MGIGVRETVCCAISLAVKIGIGSSILVSKANPKGPLDDQTDDKVYKSEANGA